MGRLTALPGRLTRLPPRVAGQPKVADNFYQSPEWKALRERRQLDPDWFAAKRRARNGERLILDHVVEIKDGGAPLDPANTKWLTFSEHQAKTAAERGRRARGQVGGGQKSG